MNFLDGQELDNYFVLRLYFLFLYFMFILFMHALLSVLMLLLDT